MMKPIFALSLAALALSACGGTANRGVDSVHQAVVSRTDYVYDVANGLGAQDRAALVAWMKSINVAYGDRIAVDDPTANSADRSVVAEIANYYGLELERVAPVTNGPIAPGKFRVVVSRAKADVPGCPDWSRSSLDTFSGSIPSNYGCATNASIAAMVADPEDLVSGKQRAPAGYNKPNRGGKE